MSSFRYAPLLLVGLLACSDDETSTKAPPAPLAPLSSAPLTTEQVLQASRMAMEPEQTLNPQVPEHIDQMLADGYGEFTVVAGEPVLPLTLDDSPAPTGTSPTLLTRFVHLADIQLVDDESPARLSALDVPDLGGAFRPQEGHGCRILNAAVRTINKLHEDLPIDAVVLGGDNADNGQQNEHDWLRAVLGGSASVECDSGVDNDPIPGPDNDPKDPFVADGLVVPWLWVTGNHDILFQGISPANDVELFVGDYASTGTRDWALPGAPVIKDEVIPDPARHPVTVEGMLADLAADGDGHGIDESVQARGKANYATDLGTDVRLVVIDTAAPTGGAEGVITQADIDSFIKPALDQAVTDGKWVILTSHHSSNTLSDGGTIGGTPVAGAVTTTAWQTFVSGYDNVLMHIAGHSHIHRVHRREAGGARYWEVISAALGDYPHQMRLVEVWDHGAEFVSVKMISLDYSTEGDPVAAEGRRRGIVDFTSGWANESRGNADDRNVEIFVPKG